MTRCLKDKTVVPSGGWRARQPETGTVVRGLSHNGLIAAVAKYRSANGLPVEGNQRRQVENMVCDTLSPDEAERLCKCLDEDDAKNPPEMRKWRKSSSDLLNFALAVKGVIEHGLKGTRLHVSKEEAETRAAICAGCIHNVPLGSCFGCGEMGRIYRSIVGHLTTSKDHALQSCDVCGCNNRLQTHFSKEVLADVSSKQGLSADQFPSWCWKKEVLA